MPYRIYKDYIKVIKRSLPFQFIILSILLLISLVLMFYSEILGCIWGMCYFLVVCVIEFYTIYISFDYFEKLMDEGKKKKSDSNDMSENNNCPGIIKNNCEYSSVRYRKNLEELVRVLKLNGINSKNKIDQLFTLYNNELSHKEEYHDFLSKYILIPSAAACGSGMVSVIISVLKGETISAEWSYIVAAMFICLIVASFVIFYIKGMSIDKGNLRRMIEDLESIKIIFDNELKLLETMEK